MSLLTHLRQQSSVELATRLPWRCACGQRFATKQGLRGHELFKHPQLQWGHQQQLPFQVVRGPPGPPPAPPLAPPPAPAPAPLPGPPPGKVDGRRDNRGSQKRRRLWPDEHQRVLSDARRMRDSGDTYDRIASATGASWTLVIPQPLTDCGLTWLGSLMGSLLGSIFGVTNGVIFGDTFWGVSMCKCPWGHSGDHFW